MGFKFQGVRARLAPGKGVRSESNREQREELGLLGQRGGLIMQTRRASMAEAIVNTVVGCVIGYLIVLAVITLDPSPTSAAAWSVALNLPASAARQFVIRRLFNGVE
jgi:hypothetical protein